MKQSELLSQWLAEEEAAQIHGWDFSHIHGRYEEGQDLPWDFDQLVRRFLLPEHRILDMDTGGGEFLLSLGHPHSLTAATEGYPPNAALCRETLLPLGVDFREADGGGPLPFPDGSFDLVLNRHGDYLPAEVFRVLKPGGIFLTQQVGSENDRELVELLLDPVPPLPFPRQYLSIAREDSPSPSSTWTWPPGSSADWASPSWRSGRPSAPSGSGMWARWSGSPGSFHGSSPVSPWRSAGRGCSKHRISWNETR